MTENKESMFLPLLALSLLFGGALAALDIWYSDWQGMWDTWVHIAAWVAILGHIGVLYLFFIVWRNWKYGDYDPSRRWIWVACVAMIIFIAAFKAANNEAKQVIIDSNKAKQEQGK